MDKTFKLNVETKGLRGCMDGKVLGIDRIRLYAEHNCSLFIKDRYLIAHVFLKRVNGDQIPANQRWEIEQNMSYIILEHPAVNSKNFGKPVPRTYWNMLIDELEPVVKQWADANLPLLRDVELNDLTNSIKSLTDELADRDREYQKYRQSSIRATNALIRAKEKLEAQIENSTA